MKNWIFLLLLSAFAAQSCHKDDVADNNPDPNNPVTLKQIASIHYQYSNGDSETETLKYDNQGRVIQYNNGVDLISMAYSGSQVKITEVRILESNLKVFDFTGTMDAAGRLSGGTGTGNYNLNIVDQRVFKMEYTADGYLKKATLTIDNNHTYDIYYTWQNGNLTKVEDFTDGVKQSTSLFEFGTGNADRTPFGPYAHVSNMVPTGKKSKEMWTKYTSKRDGAAAYTGTSTFTKDSNGYITTQQVVNSNGSDVTIKYDFK